MYTIKTHITGKIAVSIQHNTITHEFEELSFEQLKNNVNQMDNSQHSELTELTITLTIHQNDKLYFMQNVSPEMETIIHNILKTKIVKLGGEFIEHLDVFKYIEDVFISDCLSICNLDGEYIIKYDCPIVIKDSAMIELQTLVSQIEHVFLKILNALSKIESVFHKDIACAVSTNQKDITLCQQKLTEQLLSYMN